MNGDARLNDRLRLAADSFELDAHTARARVAVGVQTRQRNRRIAVFVVAALIVGLLAYAGINAPFDSTTPEVEPSPSVGVAPETLPRGEQDAAVLTLAGSPIGRIPGLPTDASELDLAPDHRTLAFVTADGGTQARIATIQVDGTQLRILTPKNAIAEQPAWSPDGNRIAFKWSPDGGHTDIYVMGADGSNFTRLTDDPFEDSAPRWSPNGSTIVYVNAGTRRWKDQQFLQSPDIYTVPAAGGHPTRLTTERGPDLYPDYAPDGTQIVYRHGDELRVMNSDGSGSHVLLPSGSYFAPRWSPDGTQIAYGTYDGSYRPNVGFEGTKSKRPLLILHVLNVETGARYAVGGTGFVYDLNAPIWWSNDEILIRRVGH
jgi:dipeptidyl aminopeptidase/acylaminoacyl peptidase